MSPLILAQQGEPVFTDRLTGDWGGIRTRLAARGVTLDFESAHYYQGLLSGEGDEDFDYAGRLDALVDLDTGRLGLWPGGTLRTHTEYRYGNLGSNLGGVLLSTNSALILPVDQHEEWIVTSIHLAQRFGERLSVLIGRINAVDLLAGDPFFGGAGRSRFLNLAFSAPPSGVTPPVLAGVVASWRAEPLNWTFMVFDPDDRTDDYWPDDFFDSGVNVSISANYSGRMAGRASGITLTGTYTTKDDANLGELLLPPELRTGERNGSWFIGVQLTHFLRQHSGRPGDGWGLFLKLAASDGNPNPYQGSLVGGIGGKGLLPSRPRDTFGLGYFYMNFSDDLQSALDPIVTFHDEQGIEAFYNFVVTDWLLVAVDLQYIDPALGDSDDALVGGMRATIRF